MRNLFFRSPTPPLGLVDFGVKNREVVAARMVQEARRLKDVAFGEDAWVGVGSEDFSDEYGVVSCGDLVVYGAFYVGNAFLDGGGFDFAGGYGG